MMPIRLTRCVQLLILLSFAVFLVQQTGDRFFGTDLFSLLALTPRVSSFFQGWQVLTYAFVHADVLQLIFNLMMLAMMGSELETVWGSSRFFRYYLFCALSGALAYVLLQAIFARSLGALPPMAGASAAIYGLLVAYGILFGERVLLFMMIFPMKAKHFVWVLALIELLTTVYSSRMGWAGVAQLGGMAAGWVFLWVGAGWRAYQKQRPKKLGTGLKKGKARKASHLKLVVRSPEEFESSEDDSSNPPRTWH